MPVINSSHLQFNSPDALTVLVTGASSGIGLGLVERFLDAYSSPSSPPLPITIVMASRNAEKGQLAIRRLSSTPKYQHCIRDNNSANDDAPVQLDFLQIDLTSIDSIKHACVLFKQKYGRVDMMYLNAGMIPVKGVNFLKGLIFFLKSPVAFFQDASVTLDQEVGKTIKGDSEIGFAFAANLFGHYIMIKQLQDVMSQGCRIMWTTSTTSETALNLFKWNDIMGLKSKSPYESSKIATNLASIGLNDRFEKEGRADIKSFLADPGVATTNILDDSVHWIINCLIIVPFMYLASFLFSFITLTGKNGAVSLFYLSGLDKNLKVYAVDGSELNLPEWDTHIKYCSNYDNFSGTSFVTVKKVISSSSTGSGKDGEDLKRIGVDEGARLLDFLDNLYKAKVKFNDK